MTFEPEIVGFLCNWCSYAGADLAGVSRIQYPPNIRAIRVMCSARVDPIIIIEALMQGADGVLVARCHLGDCHYIDANYETTRKIDIVKKLMERAGMEPERLRLEDVSAAEGQRFADIVEDFTNQIKHIGPNPLGVENPDINLLEKMSAIKLVASNFRLRALVGRERALIEEGDAYGEKRPKEEFDESVDISIDAEYIRWRIYLLTKDKPLSVKQVAKRIGLDPREALQHIVVMRHKGLIALDHIEGTSPFYTAMEVV